MPIRADNELRQGGITKTDNGFIQSRSIYRAQTARDVLSEVSAINRKETG